MALYVLALAETPLRNMAFGGRQLHVESIDAVHAICEMRAASPEPSEAELRAQHALVLEIASRSRAILPLRFGSLVTKLELRAAIRSQRQEIQAGFDLVRDRMQMTIRVTGRRRASAAIPGPVNGREYLARRRQQVSPPLPPAALAFLKRLAPLVAAERREPGAGALLATVYHLVDVLDMPRYSALARKAPRSIVVTGPWPPFAFTPSLR